jgi:peroxiredoxin
MQELPALERLSQRLRSQGLQVVGVAVDDTVANVVEARDRYGLTFPLLIDTGATSKRAYQLKGFPESFLLDAEHRILLVQDPAQGGSLVAKIIGPREWAAPRTVALFEQLLQRQPTVGPR